MGRVTPAGSRLCSAVAKDAGDDPGGSATPFDAYLGVEIPLPWHWEVADSPGFPEVLRETLDGAREKGAIGKYVGLVPGPGLTRHGHARVLLMRRPGSGPFAAYERREYLLPTDALVSFAEALSGRDLSGFERYRVVGTDARDILVCTHGSRDACCGKFGYPVFDQLRSRHAGPGLRVWRASHIGEHRFSPTLIDFPEGRYWGHLEPLAVEALARRDADVAGISRFCRGWAGMEGRFEQLAEREILAREGWAWTGYRRSGRTLRADEAGGEVLIEYETPEGERGRYEATIEMSGTVMTLSDTGHDPLEEEPQYRVVRLEAARE